MKPAAHNACTHTLLRPGCPQLRSAVSNVDTLSRPTIRAQVALLISAVVIATADELITCPGCEVELILPVCGQLLHSSSPECHECVEPFVYGAPGSAGKVVGEFLGILGIRFCRFLTDSPFHLSHPVAYLGSPKEGGQRGDQMGGQKVGQRGGQMGGQRETKGGDQMGSQKETKGGGGGQRGMPK